MPQVRRSSGRDGEFGHHAGRQMRHVVAVQHPARGLACVDGDGHHPHRRHMHGVAYRAGKPLSPKAHHLEGVTVQVLDLDQASATLVDRFGIHDKPGAGSELLGH